MDPDEVFRQIRQATGSDDTVSETAMFAVDLLTWLLKGGFLPARTTQNEVVAECERAILRLADRWDSRQS